MREYQVDTIWFIDDTFTLHNPRRQRFRHHWLSRRLGRRHCWRRSRRRCWSARHCGWLCRSWHDWTFGRRRGHRWRRGHSGRRRCWLWRRWDGCGSRSGSRRRSDSKCGRLGQSLFQVLRRHKRIRARGRLDFRPIALRRQRLHGVATMQETNHAVVLARPAAQVEFLRHDRLVRGIDERAVDPHMRVGRQRDLRPGRRLVRPGIILHNLLDDRHRLAFGHPGHNLALELGLAAHVDIAGHDHGRTSHQRHGLELARDLFQGHRFCAVATRGSRCVSTRVSAGAGRTGRSPRCTGPRIPGRYRPVPHRSFPKKRFQPSSCSS